MRQRSLQKGKYSALIRRLPSGVNDEDGMARSHTGHLNSTEHLDLNHPPFSRFRKVFIV